MKNILYFEAVGMDFKKHEHSDIGNYRIRTAFKNLDGIAHYIDIGNTFRYTSELTKCGQKLAIESEWALGIDELFMIKDKNKMHYDLGVISIQVKRDRAEINKLNYTKEHIRRWINENLNCNFDGIEVLDEYYGYHVPGGYKNGEYIYHLIDDADIDHEKAEKRKEAFNLLDKEYRNKLKSKYRNIQIEKLDNDSMTIKCFASDEKLSLSNLERYKIIKVS